MIPDPSGQLAELVVYITSTRGDLYRHQILLRDGLVNSLRPRQNGRHFADDTFRRIFLNENLRTLLKNWLKIVPKVRINNIPALVQIMAWRQTGDKPLSESMMVSLPTHICVIRPQWVNKTPASVTTRSLPWRNVVNESWVSFTDMDTF